MLRALFWTNIALLHLAFLTFTGYSDICVKLKIQHFIQWTFISPFFLFVSPQVWPGVPVYQRRSWGRHAWRVKSSLLSLPPSRPTPALPPGVSNSLTAVSREWMPSRLKVVNEGQRWTKQRMWKTTTRLTNKHGQCGALKKRIRTLIWKIQNQSSCHLWTL